MEKKEQKDSDLIVEEVKESEIQREAEKTGWLQPPVEKEKRSENKDMFIKNMDAPNLSIETTEIKESKMQRDVKKPIAKTKTLKEKSKAKKKVQKKKNPFATIFPFKNGPKAWQCPKCDFW